MGGAYPVRSDGSQGYRPGSQSAGPANTNRPYRLPTPPANRNIGGGSPDGLGRHQPGYYPKPGSGSWHHPGTGWTPNSPPPFKSPGRSAIAATALRGMAPRFIPYIGWFLMAQDLIDVLNGLIGLWSAFNSGATGEWTECPTCPPYVIHAYTMDNTAACPVGCLSFQAIVTVPYGTPQPVTVKRVIMWRKSNAAGTRFDNVRARYRTVNGPFEWPAFWPAPNIGPYRDPALEPTPGPAPTPSNPDPVGDPFPEPNQPARSPVPNVNPHIDPMTLPTFAPQPHPRPIPWRAIPGRRPNPWRDPEQQTQRGPQVSPRVNPRDRIIPEPGPGPSLSYQPGRPPVVRAPERGGDTGPRDDRRPRQPPRREREKKVRRNTIPHILKKVANVATESCDAIEAVWKAIPYGDRIRYHDGKKKPTCGQQAAALYDLFDKIDWDQALAELVKNEIEDRAYGQLGKQGGRGARGAQDDGFAPRSERGPQAGPGDTAVRKFVHDAIEAIRSMNQ